MKVFLSYAADDQAWADALAKHLEEAGFEVWNPSAELFPGDNWPLAIGRALEEAEAMVVLVSPAMAASRWVQNEVQFALGARRFKDRVIPVIIRPTPDIPWILRRFLTVQGDPAEASRQIMQILAASATSPSTHPRARSR
jgi:hypothetical protein